MALTSGFSVDYGRMRMDCAIWGIDGWIRSRESGWNAFPTGRRAMLGTVSENRSSIEYLTAAQTAELLQVARSTLQTWRRLGTGPVYVKFPRGIRYHRTDIELWMNSRKKGETE